MNVISSRITNALRRIAAPLLLIAVTATGITSPENTRNIRNTKNTKNTTVITTMMTTEPYADELICFYAVLQKQLFFVPLHRQYKNRLCVNLRH